MTNVRGILALHGLRPLIILSAFFFSPLLFFWARLRRSAVDTAHLRILVIPHLTRVGDLVCATPVMATIKKKYPESFVAVLVTKKIAPLLLHNPNVDGIVIYRSDRILSVLNKVRKMRFDWSFNLAALSIGTAFSLFGFIPFRAKTIRQGRPFMELLTDWTNNYTLLYRHHTYLPRHYLNLLKFVCIENAEEKKEVFTTLDGDEKVSHFFEQSKISNDDFVVGISITAGNKIKEWGDEKFAELAKKIVERYHAKIIFIGAEEDETRINSVIGKDYPNFSRLTLKGSDTSQTLDNLCLFKATHFTLEELPSLIKKLSLYIAVDTGPIYIAHALGVPLIDITGPVDVNEQPPQDEKSICVSSPSEIKPSSFVFKRPGSPKEHQHALETITVDMVFDAVRQLADRLTLR
jgi:heptosyltransferase II